MESGDGWDGGSGGWKMKTPIFEKQFLKSEKKIKSEWACLGSYLEP